MYIDKAGRDDFIRGVNDGRPRTFRQITNRDDGIPFNAHVCLVARSTGTINDSTARDQDVKYRVLSGGFVSVH